MKTLNIIFLFFLTSQAFSNDLRGICFDRSVSLESVVSYSSQITAPGDRFLKNSSKHCIEIVADEKRMDLYDKFIGMNFKIIRRYGNTLESQKRECLFEIENIKARNQKKISYELSKKPFANEEVDSSTRKTTTALRMMESKTAQFLVNGNIVTITCRLKAKFAEVDISLGSKNTNVLTTLQMSKNQRVDLAQVVEDLSKKSSGNEISTGNDRYSVTNKKTVGTFKEQFFITLK
ncbi:hypothetical protein [Halobacteriovorax sp. HLS]|uniref:hypothetical protein n=1 Tax=Halobacteriovorax sp. HLS TaxID=2234000 RepID=UPI000FD8C3F0|nr:hypothetical protein [Halobacteriovorax sp. HLS]